MPESNCKLAKPLKPGGLYHFPRSLNLVGPPCEGGHLIISPRWNAIDEDAGGTAGSGARGGSGSGSGSGAGSSPRNADDTRVLRLAVSIKAGAPARVLIRSPSMSAEEYTSDIRATLLAGFKVKIGVFMCVYIYGQIARALDCDCLFAICTLGLRFVLFFFLCVLCVLFSFFLTSCFLAVPGFVTCILHVLTEGFVFVMRLFRCSSPPPAPSPFHRQVSDLEVSLVDGNGNSASVPERGVRIFVEPRDQPSPSSPSSSGKKASRQTYLAKRSTNHSKQVLPRFVLDPKLQEPRGVSVPSPASGGTGAAQKKSAAAAAARAARVSKEGVALVVRVEWAGMGEIEQVR